MHFAIGAYGLFSTIEDAIGILGVEDLMGEKFKDSSVQDAVGYYRAMQLGLPLDGDYQFVVASLVPLANLPVSENELIWI